MNISKIKLKIICRKNLVNISKCLGKQNDYRDLDIFGSKIASNLYTAMLLLRFVFFIDILGFQRFFSVWCKSLSSSGFDAIFLLFFA